MYYLGALWLGALFGWLACSMTIRNKLERENSILRREIEQLELQIEDRDIATARAYEIGKRDGAKRCK
jgi:hypothetical protein